MRIFINKLLRNDKSLMLAYDQGLEHGPKDLDMKTVDPKYIFDIALEGMYEAIIVQHGVAEKYYQKYYKEVPLVIKLNGKTSMTNIAPISRQLCSVERAIKLGAVAVGYTVYTGSPNEPEIFSEFSKIVETAHDYGMPVIGWMYPRGPGIDERSVDVLAYAARVGLELGADMLKMKYNDNPEGFKWIVKCAGKARVMVAGGDRIDEQHFLQKSEEIMKTGVTGMAVGRNVWQHQYPMAISKALRKIVHHGATTQEAERIYEEEIHKK
ncbi:TPA: fructose-bisphosphate aldolase [Candidatus Woesearchaeota archaeon]|nr:fructose-bisphosphate aldolase [Candidatus Woesearchaeota archaeon]HIH54948.1 fructose-bisphosphate aldolase [Candidatus Woesearchaeota archaeon]HIJ02641.1 fructose-bisphosphate aldolase [Candidatus Woesearchaeota archaeon]HIJ13621.1 fructose-bisphosphate aldolase [Candidatus Woesearchaeota archaeon]